MSQTKSILKNSVDIAYFMMTWFGTMVIAKTDAERVMIMAKFFADGHLRFLDGEWRDDNGDVVHIQEVVHGAWERYDDSKYLYCSNCGEPAATSEDVSWHGYCPICGAIMDGKE